jgi:hypothetical protein
MRLHAPAHYHTAVQVGSGGPVHPALVGMNVGDVCRPYPIGRLGAKVARQQIVCNGQFLFAVGSEDKLSLAPGADTVALHYLSDPLFGDFLTSS